MSAETSGPDDGGRGGAAALLRVEGMYKRFGDREVIRGIDLEVSHGEVICVIGASGSGKSTLLRCINHLSPPDFGTIELDGELIGFERLSDRLVRPLADADLVRQQAKFGFVFQSFNLFPHMSVLENITLAPTTALGESPREARGHALELLERVGLGDRGGARPGQLSGGQQQRVAIARALAMRPKLLLLDEPTSALDPELVSEVLGVVRDLALKGMTMLIVTHEMEFARDVADRILFIHEGRIAVDGSPREVLDESEDPRAAAFLRQLRARRNPQ